FHLNDKHYFSSGTYSDTISNYLGCDSICRINIHVTQLNAGIIKNGRKLSSTNLNVLYQWIRCDSLISVLNGEDSGVFYANFPGFYAVIITKDDCVDTSECIEIKPEDVSINSIGFNGNSLQVFPNPASEFIILKSELKGDKVEVLLYNALGQILNRVYLGEEE